VIAVILTAEMAADFGIVDKVVHGRNERCAGIRRFQGLDATPDRLDRCPRFGHRS
jgi:hypothetical protein